MTYNFYVDFLYFVIYSFLGWVCEVLYCSLLANKLINRGFLNGPVCPIYGFGSLMIVTFLMPVRQNLALVFASGFFITSILEYITSFAMEKMFHSKWWDYSDKKLNINGRVCLLNSILFGLLSVFVMFEIHPEVVNVIDNLSYIKIQAFAIIFIVILTVDTTISVQTVFSLNERMQNLRDLSVEIKEKLDAKQLYMESQLSERIALLSKNIHESEKYRDMYELVERISGEINKLYSSNKLLHRRLINAFPEMKSTKFQEQLQNIKNAIENRKLK